MSDFTKTPRPFYPPLSSQNREIRLLHLEPRQVQPDNPSNKLQCRLSVVSLDSNPSYEALSYRWGNATSTVLVDGHDVLIPRNLDEALRGLRLDNGERVLWADAICIDQSQVEERNEQVAMMADIYRKCEQCLIWFGHGGDSGRANDLGVDGLQDLCTALSKKHHLNQPNAPRINPMFGLTRLPLMFFNMADWWKRIWVVQEVILAPKSLVIFGVFKIQWSDLVRAVEFINEHDIASAWNPNIPETDDLCDCMDWIKVTFIWEELLVLRDHIYRLLEAGKPSDTEKDVSERASASDENFPDILDVLMSVRHRDCTDARDKVFGILSLVQDWKGLEPIKADYSKDALQVFTEFAVQMVQRGYGPKTLLLARGATLPLRNMIGLPSWVPDWTDEGSGYDRHLFTAARQSSQPQPKQSTSVFGRTLLLHNALLIGKISSIGVPGAPLHRSYGQPPSMANYQRFVTMLDSWRSFAGMTTPLTLENVLRRHITKIAEETWAQPGPDPNPTSESQPEPNPDPDPSSTWSGSFARLLRDLERSEHTVDFMPQILDIFATVCYYQSVLQRIDPDEEAFLRTLVHDTYPLHLGQRQEYKREALCILRVLLVFYSMFADPDRLLTRLNSVVLTKMGETLDMVRVWRRRLFRVGGPEEEGKAGMLGIGPGEVKVEDEVWVFDGVQTPFVLREIGMREVEGKGERRCYELVGYCYVDRLGREGLDWKRAEDVYLQ